MVAYPSSSSRSPWASPLAVALFIVAALLLSFSAVRIIQKAYAIHQERMALDAKVRAAEQKSRDLSASLNTAGSPDAVERLAKEKLDMKGPGEEVVVVEAARPVLASTSNSSAFIGRFVPRWIQSIVNFFQR